MADLGHHQILKNSLILVYTKGEIHRMNVAQMRTEVVKAYGSGKQWTYNVSKMSDSKVTAIYMNMKKSGKIK